MSEDVKVTKVHEISNPLAYGFPEGFITTTTRKVWIDGAAKKAASEDESFEERQPNHAVTFEFDWSKVNLAPLLERLTKTSNSLIVTAQQHVRSNVQSDEILEAMSMDEKTFRFSVAELLEVRSAAPALSKAKTAARKLSAEERAELLAYLEETK